jgi:tetratricopeptide (TPR) repeat protein
MSDKFSWKKSFLMDFKLLADWYEDISVMICVSTVQVACKVVLHAACCVPRRPTSRITLILLFSLLVLGLNVSGAWARQVETARSCRSLRSMGRVYIASGGYEKAQPFLERALHVAQGIRPRRTSDSEVYACMLDLAYLYKNQGRLDEAERMCLSGLELQEKVYHEDHPYVAYTLRILSEIYRRQGRYRQARSRLERALGIMHSVCPNDDQQSAPFEVDMGRLLAERGCLAEAEAHFEKAIAVIEGSYGPEHLYTTKVLVSMAALYMEQQRYANAEELIQRARPIQERIYGPNHHFLVPVRLLEARIAQAKGDLTDMKRLLDQSLRVVEEQVDSDRLVEGEILSRLGQYHLQSNEYAQAEVMLTRALNVLEGIFDEYHPRVADVLEILAQLRRETGEVTEAARLQQRAKDIRLRQQIDDGPVAKVTE